MSGERRCAQCGRIGVRGFKTLGPCVHEPTGAVIEGIVICTSESACRKRWPKASEPQKPVEGRRIER